MHQYAQLGPHLDCVDERLRKPGGIQVAEDEGVVVDEVGDDGGGEREQAAAKHLAPDKHGAQACVQQRRVGLKGWWTRVRRGRIRFRSKLLTRYRHRAQLTTVINATRINKKWTGEYSL